MGAARKISVIGLFYVVLVAVLVVGENEVTKDSGDGSGKVSTTSKIVKAMCQVCDYKETCVETLSNVTSTDPKELIKAGFDSAVKGIKDGIKHSSVVQAAGKLDDRVSQAYGVCEELLDTAIDDLQRSFDKVTKFELSKMDDYVAELKTWLSGVSTNQETCIDAFQNTTGDAGEKMKQILKTPSEVVSNALAMVSGLTSRLPKLRIPGLNLKKKPSPLPNIPSWVDNSKSGLLQGTLKPNAVVAQDGSGQFKTVNDALKTVPINNTAPFVIQIKAGVYNENVDVPRRVENVVFIGDGADKTKITGNKNFIDGVNTYRTATVAINGDGFMAKDIGFENSAGAEKHQAVAVRVSADRSIFYRCQFDGYQDTLYTHTYRQFYRECTITGTIDFIFGDAATVFQSCTMKVRKPMDNQGCMVTAQGRKEQRGIGGLILQNCTITAEPDVLSMKPAPKQYLGRPWKEFSRTIIMQSFIDKNIVPDGWSPWTETFGQDTCYYGEYQNRGPGSDISKRVKWKGMQKIAPKDADGFTASKFIQGDTWIKTSNVPYDPGMMNV